MQMVNEDASASILNWYKAELIKRGKSTTECEGCDGKYRSKGDELSLRFFPPSSRSQLNFEHFNLFCTKCNYLVGRSLSKLMYENEKKRDSSS